LIRYVARRVLGAGARLFCISLILFVMLQAPPGGPADIFAADPAASPEAIARIKTLWGLDRPVLVQYGVWLGNAITGHWGNSFSEHRPVSSVVFERVPATLLLTGSALLFSLVVGVLLGAVGAATRRRGVQSVVQALAVLGMSVPTFWSGMLVLLFFSVYLRWIPSSGMATIGAGFSLADRFLHLVGPAVVLGSVYVAQWARYTQAGLAESLREDYIRTARAQGLGEMMLLFKHALPNASIPLVTVVGLEVPRLLAGAMVTEVVFAWPGLGRLLTASLLNRDYPVAMGVLMMLGVTVVLANLITDSAYHRIDPRVRVNGASA